MTKHVEGESYDFTRLETLQSQVIRVNKKTERVADLEAQICAIYGIPLESLVILQRHEPIFNQTVRTELYNMEWRKQKIIEEVSKFDHGTMLFIEEGDAKKGKLEEYKWYQEFTKDSERLILNLNNPLEDPEALVFAIKVEMKRDNTVLDLK